MADILAAKAASDSIATIHQQLRDMGLKPIVVQIIEENDTFKVLIRLDRMPDELLKNSYMDVPLVYEFEGKRVSF